ncbi:TonB-dependent receptor plug domain-containing protein [uncultured Chryseobacterium sp.]|uniref:TonB-dependent receptor plug domain-containing protein n=1 Tax=uncultured Chryseobacterium sp. TaxID=259322 RepID=UPI0025CF0C99|nr:TonB-dependent receptor plug domain-containing protein [uncultured Chryseobacterium sp.]
MENNSIDKTFNEASKTLEEPATFPGFDKVWAKVEEKLDKKEEKKRKGMGLWIPYGIAASLLIGSGIFYFTSESETPAVPKQVMAQQILAPKSQQAEIAANIRKTDSIVKANIQKEIFKVPTAKIAYRKVPEIDVPHAVARVSDMPLPQVFPKETTAVAEDKIIADTEKRYHAEEVITTGIRKEKSSMVQALAANSTVKKKIYELNAVADTAEAVYPASVFNRNEPLQEPEILAYNKGYFKKDNFVANNQSGSGNRLGNKEVATVIRGKMAGVNINSISEVPGSGKVDISISCQGSSQLNNNPLFIIDGVAATQEVFIRLDPKKIESMQVFKGEKATALFGSKAANGVILVETKDISKKEKRRLKRLLKEKLPR